MLWCVTWLRIFIKIGQLFRGLRAMAMELKHALLYYAAKGLCPKTIFRENIFRNRCFHFKTDFAPSGKKFDQKILKMSFDIFYFRYFSSKLAESCTNWSWIFFQNHSWLFRMRFISFWIYKDKLFWLLTKRGQNCTGWAGVRSYVPSRSSILVLNRRLFAWKYVYRQKLSDINLFCYHITTFRHFIHIFKNLKKSNLAILGYFGLFGILMFSKPHPQISVPSFST